MREVLESVRTPLFRGLSIDDLMGMKDCLRFFQSSYKKGQVILMESEHMHCVGIVLSGRVDMIKEDLWGGKTLLARMGKDELFGESFACGSDTESAVTFLASEDTNVLFLPFSKVMRTCSMACEFHHRLVENMVSIIADINRTLMRKVEIISQRSLREKILTYLSFQAQKSGSRYFTIDLDRSELAEYLCADRSAVSRELSALKQEGILDFEKNHFRILQ